MANEATVMTLQQIWPELAALVGPEPWEELQSQLRILLLAYDVTNDPSERTEIIAQLQERMAQAPDPVVNRFDDEFERISNMYRGSFDARQRAEGIHQWIIKTVRAGGTAVKMPDEAKTWARYTDIACPRRVWIGTKRISVVVRLTLQQPEYSEVASELQVVPELPVIVRLEATGFDLLGPAEQEAVLLPDADSAPVVFDLAPRRAGYNDLVFDFFQAGNPLGTASVIVEVTIREGNVIEQLQAGPQLRSGQEVEAPDFILYISYEQRTSMLSFELRPKGGIGERYEPLDLKLTPLEYTQRIYQRLTSITKRQNPQALVSEGSIVPSLNSEDAEDMLREEGQSLWHDLIPRELRQRYERERMQWRDRSLLIVSDEPHIPWELLWPYGDWDDDGPLCLQMPMARWLRRSPQGDVNYEPMPLLRIDELAILVPSDSGLHAAQRERTMLTQLIKHYHLLDVSPTDRTRQGLKRFLALGGYHWLHVAAHGNFYPDNPGAEAVIWLQDQQPFTVRAIDATIERYVRSQRPAFFFNACESGQSGQAITGIAGWASRLIGAGAGLFLAPLWAIKDNRAFRFSERFYQALLQCQTVAQAVRQARNATRQAGDPTWLAYCLYAHPNARIRLNDTEIYEGQAPHS